MAPEPATRGAAEGAEEAASSPREGATEAAGPQAAQEESGTAKDTKEGKV